ncbi:hypothetical protein ACD661_02665 [Legionella lytica]|uniref:Transmembrane protein n=1 Tax=Legionella lytica TaxID=96232 RepID=A0ABW8D435_9GAMM
MANIYENKYLFLGVLGALIVLYGTTQWPPQPYYIIGAIALLGTAIHYKLFYYVALELILIAGHLAIVFGSGRYTQLALPILLCFQLLIFYLFLAKESSIFLLFGICGIALLSVGFAYDQQWIFGTGSSFIAIYSYYSGSRGRSPAYIWAVLNSIFALLSVYKIYFL